MKTNMGDCPSKTTLKKTLSVDLNEKITWFFTACHNAVEMHSNKWKIWVIQWGYGERVKSIQSSK